MTSVAMSSKSWLPDAPSHILCMRYGLQMQWVYAARGFAKMVNLSAFWQWPIEKLESDSMDSFNTPTELPLAITSAPSPDPEPTSAVGLWLYSVAIERR
jgi:hypothetical protein